MDAEETPARTERATTLLDAAIAVIGEAGLRGLTHRAVDARAGLPTGSTSYYYRTRSALLHGVVSRLLELDAGDFQRFAPARPDRAALARALTRLYGEWSQSGRDRQRARYTLYLDTPGDPAVRELLDTANLRLATDMEALLRTLGCAHPRRDARLLIALLDGLLYDRIARPHPPVSATELRRRIDVVLGTVLP